MIIKMTSLVLMPRLGITEQSFGVNRLVQLFSFACHFPV